MENVSLGPVSQISIGTNDLERSVSFYEKLGFRRIGGAEQPYPWAHISDGSRLILLNEDGNTYMGLLYMNKDLSAKVAELRAEGIELPEPQQVDGFPPSVFFTDPNGFPIGIIEADGANTYQPDGPILAHFTPDQWAEGLPMPNEKIGLFGEFCFPVKDLDASIAFWQKLGFDINEYGGPYRWAIAYDGQQVIGLHETTEFEVTAITYFAKDMAERIKKLNEEGLETTVFGGTGGNDSNQILQSPEGSHFFLFSF
jgi:catechol 2,3-dioxygenase-like lactoylglutathione lyase family enzyme